MMNESSRRYNLRDTRKKPQGELLKRWEVEYSKLISNENRRIPLETVKTAVQSAFEDGMFEQWRITLKCPLSRQRIKVPARYADCTHIECFDLETFLRMKTQKNIRVCPICQKEIEKPLANLRIDKYMENVLSTLPDAIQVELMSDGSFTEVHGELVIEPSVIDDDEPYIQDVKQEAVEESDECITLSDDEGEFMLDISVIDMKPISLMPLNADIKPNIAASSVPEQINFREDQERQETESPIPLVPSTVPTTIVKTEKIAVDPITNHLHSATPKAVLLTKRESPEWVSSVPMELRLQATLTSIDPTIVDSKPNISASSEPDQIHAGKAQEIQETEQASSSKGHHRSSKHYHLHRNRAKRRPHGSSRSSSPESLSGSDLSDSAIGKKPKSIPYHRRANPSTRSRSPRRVRGDDGKRHFAKIDDSEKKLQHHRHRSGSRQNQSRAVSLFKKSQCRRQHSTKRHEDDNRRRQRDRSPNYLTSRDTHHHSSQQRNKTEPHTHIKGDDKETISTHSHRGRSREKLTERKQPRKVSKSGGNSRQEKRKRNSSSSSSSSGFTPGRLSSREFWNRPFRHKGPVKGVRGLCYNCLSTPEHTALDCSNTCILCGEAARNVCKCTYKEYGYASNRALITDCLHVLHNRLERPLCKKRGKKQTNFNPHYRPSSFV